MVPGYAIPQPLDRRRDRLTFATAYGQPGDETARQILRVKEAVRHQALGHTHGQLGVVRDRADRPLFPTGPPLVLGQLTIMGSDGRRAHPLDRPPQRITHGPAQQRADKPCPLRHRLCVYGRSAAATGALPFLARSLAPGSSDAFSLASDATPVRILRAGTHRLSRPLEMDQPLSLIGDGRESTYVVCTSPGCVVQVSGNGCFSASNVTFTHERAQGANVLERA
ncbi:MAG TPA: hypothetical protein VJY65_07570 [Chloroflexota bacterium]|nr:hypothetical protein [Chloroflexota bacterium]